MTSRALAVSLTFALFAQAAPAQPGEVVAEIRVHGNHLTPDAEIIAIAGLTIGAPVTADTIEQVRKALKASGKFEEVEVVKRFASIADPTKIALILIVNEGAVRVDFEEGPDGEDIAVIKRRSVFSKLMYLPILNAEDGYGLTYGV
ncbi:MAG TPA: FtsQ-type POTRA domain-containing protein, partial [Vicinamibacterales bacterium]|nr:FtsQ-type POTRA domain-containing protein [Vicinamibacterales bacterium]